MAPRRLALPVLAVVLVAGALWWASRPKPIAVVLETVVPGRVESSISNTRAGEVEACQRAKLSTIQGGRIDYLGVKEGDRVQAGQVLMRLWNEDQEAQVKLARTQLDATRRRVGEACNTARQAVRDATRQAELRNRGFVSPSAEEQARYTAAAREASCEAARAEVASAEAQVRARDVDQRRTVLVAPFAGTVAKITGELGEFSTPSPIGVPTPPAIDLIDDSCLYVKAPMDEVDAPRIRPGQAVRIRIDALPQSQFAGQVRRVAPYVAAVEKQARTVDVEVDFADASQARGLLVGYSTDVEIVLAVKDDVLRVPTSALREGGKLLIYRPEEGDLVERTVKTGLTSWEYTEVVEGLAQGERIVTSLEREGVKAGARVSPETPPAPTRP